MHTSSSNIDAVTIAHDHSSQRDALRSVRIPRTFKSEAYVQLAEAMPIASTVWHSSAPLASLNLSDIQDEKDGTPYPFRNVVLPIFRSHNDRVQQPWAFLLHEPDPVIQRIPIGADLVSMPHLPARREHYKIPATPGDIFYQDTEWPVTVVASLVERTDRCHCLHATDRHAVYDYC